MERDGEGWRRDDVGMRDVKKEGGWRNGVMKARKKRKERAKKRQKERKI